VPGLSITIKWSKFLISELTKSHLHLIKQFKDDGSIGE
jgi:hypothetical protein